MNAPTPSSITGLVLAGGRGSRMDGADKGLVPWQGEALAARALRRLRPQVGTVAVNANRNQAVYTAWGVPVWPDADQDFSGPLSGVLSGLTHCSTDWLATVPCDSPLFPSDLVARLSDAVIASGSRIAMAATAGDERPDAQPVFLLVHASLRQDLATALAQGERRMRRWAARHAAALAVFDDVQAFANANTPDDLAALPQSSPTDASGILRR